MGVLSSTFNMGKLSFHSSTTTYSSAQAVLYHRPLSSLFPDRNPHFLQYLSQNSPFHKTLLDQLQTTLLASPSPCHCTIQWVSEDLCVLL